LEKTKSLFLQDNNEPFSKLLSQALDNKEQGIVYDIPKEFWCYPTDMNTLFSGRKDCCFFHRRGLPMRFKEKHPLFDYQEDILKALDRGDKYFWILKSPKLGLTEFWLSWAIHQAMVNPSWQGGQVAIVVGTHGQEAKNMIERLKQICKKADIPFEIQSKFTTRQEFYVNGVHFAAHPANNIDSIRSQPNMKMILIDEGYFFTMTDSSVVREACEHYVGGADVIIVYVSTAGKKPVGFMYDIDIEKETIYTKFRITNPEKWGLKLDPRSHTRIYDPKALALIKGKPSYNRNYLGMVGYGSGDIYDLEALNHCVKEYPINFELSQLPSVLILDPAYGSSKFGCVGMVEKEGIVYVTDAEGWVRESSSGANDKVRSKLSKGYRNLIIDGHYTGMIAEFSEEVDTRGFDPKKQGEVAIDKSSQRVSEDRFRIHPRFSELIKEMRAARRKENGLLDKTKKSLDLADALIMGFDYFQSGEGEVV